MERLGCRNVFNCGVLWIISGAFVLSAGAYGAYAWATTCRNDNRDRMECIQEQIEDKLDIMNEKIDKRIDEMDKNIVKLYTRITNNHLKEAEDD